MIKAIALFFILLSMDWAGMRLVGGPMIVSIYSSGATFDESMELKFYRDIGFIWRTRTIFIALAVIFAMIGDNQNMDIFLLSIAFGCMVFWGGFLFRDILRAKKLITKSASA
ncbi:hypothetical protein [Brevundimonas sp.]|uniref:hypothetical protein n=1 Tax=Brevundimonas sp. TaxID=1871086 RepID=UPI0025BCADDB|nr:hypothetical protein [Brevundimonas sp.]